MKHKGAKMKFSKERIDDLMRAYRDYISECKYIRMPEVYKAIVNKPSKRFWVSSIRAALVVSAMMRGEGRLETMKPMKREMYQEIYRRVQELKKKCSGMSTSELCEQVIEQPAPKFYLEPSSAKIMICKERKRWIRENMKRLGLY